MHKVDFFHVQLSTACDISRAAGNTSPGLKYIRNQLEFSGEMSDETPSSDLRISAFASTPFFREPALAYSIK